MTGPEHYREAERLLDLADHGAESDDGYRMTSEWDADMLAAAQVHATLATAAATANEPCTCGLYEGHEDHCVINEWRKVIS